MEMNGPILLLINQSINRVNIISAPCRGSFQVAAGVDLKTLRLSFLRHGPGDSLRNAAVSARQFCDRGHSRASATATQIRVRGHSGEFESPAGAEPNLA